MLTIAPAKDRFANVHKASPMLHLSFLLACLMTPGAASAEEYWVDPSAGGSGRGSQDAPWGSVDAALDAVQGGDTIWLRGGDYGVLEISNANHTPAIVIAAEAGEDPVFSQVDVSSSSGVVLQGLEVASESVDFLVRIGGQDVIVEDSLLMSAPDIRSWTAQDWVNRASNGISAGGTGITIRNNYLLNVGHGIVVGATNSLVEGNVVENFSRDGMRGLADHTVFQYNLVKNAYSVDDNHDDGFQSWTKGSDGSVGTGEVVGVVLRGNTIINYEDPNQPFRSTLQGIGCFDGTFVDWVVENNVVMTDHWHGITLLGARGCKVVNNTVIDLNETTPGPPWVSVDNHKDGTPPSDCVVRNNLTTDLNNASSVVEESNIEIGMDELSDYFVDAAGYDLRLREGAAAVDQGTSDGAPEFDHDRIPRPQGDGVDVGAYEWHDGSVEPVGGAGPAWSGGSGGGRGTGGASGDEGTVSVSMTGSGGDGGGSGGTGGGAETDGDDAGSTGSGAGVTGDGVPPEGRNDSTAASGDGAPGVGASPPSGRASEDNVGAAAGPDESPTRDSQTLQGGCGCSVPGGQADVSLTPPPSGRAPAWGATVLLVLVWGRKRGARAAERRCHRHPRGVAP